MEETITSKIDTVKKLFQKKEIQNNKKDFFESVATQFGLAISSVRSGLFSRFEITDRYGFQDQLISYMETYIKEKKSQYENQH